MLTSSEAAAAMAGAAPFRHVRHLDAAITLKLAGEMPGEHAGRERSASRALSRQLDQLPTLKRPRGLTKSRWIAPTGWRWA